MTGRPTQVLAWQRRWLQSMGFSDLFIDQVEAVLMADEVFNPQSVEIPEGTSQENREKLIKEAHREFEANKLTGTDRALHDAGRALVARGFEAPGEGETGFRHPNGSVVFLDG